MKTTTYAVLFATAVTLSVTSCNKQSVHPTTSETTTRAVGGGIKSIDHWIPGGSWIDYFEVNPGWGQNPDVPGLLTGPASGVSSIRAYGALGSTLQVYAYRDGSVVMLNYGDFSVVPITLGGSNFTYTIEELEIDPSTQEVYCILRATLGGPIQLYHINYTTGAATFMGNLGGTGAYAVGTFTFVPNGSGGYSLLHVYEPSTVPASGAIMKYWTISGTTTLTTGNTVTITGNFAPGSGTLNMCYGPGSGKLFFARDNSDLYAIPFASIPTSGTHPSFGTPANVVESNANFDNRYDFGYYGL